MDIDAAARDTVDAGWLPAEAATDLAAQAGLEMADLMPALIPLAGERARPLLSGYKVGAVGQGHSRSLYFGANFEMPAGPLSLTIHAEQAVVINALTHSETGLKKLAISAAPCGVCRQFLYELASARDLEILLADRPPLRLVDTLPQAFGPNDIGVAGGLMAEASAMPAAAERQAAPLFRMAGLVAARSYVPYTGSKAGIALRLADGSVHCGFAIENAAFNPELIPLQVGVSALTMAGGAVGTVVEAAHVAARDDKLDYAPTTEILLHKLAPSCAFSAQTEPRSE
jgi:cytidine deaminase